MYQIGARMSTVGRWFGPWEALEIQVEFSESTLFGVHERFTRRFLWSLIRDDLILGTNGGGSWMSGSTRLKLHYLIASSLALTQ
jgi:hypothetical protein